MSRNVPTHYPTHNSTHKFYPSQLMVIVMQGGAQEGGYAKKRNATESDGKVFRAGSSVEEADRIDITNSRVVLSNFFETVFDQRGYQVVYDTAELMSYYMSLANGFDQQGLRDRIPHRDAKQCLASLENIYKKLLPFELRVVDGSTKEYDLRPILHGKFMVELDKKVVLGVCRKLILQILRKSCVENAPENFERDFVKNTDMYDMNTWIHFWSSLDKEEVKRNATLVLAGIDHTEKALRGYPGFRRFLGGYDPPPCGSTQSKQICDDVRHIFSLCQTVMCHIHSIKMNIKELPGE